MSTALVERTESAMVAREDPAFWEVMQKVVTMGDLSGLSPELKTRYYQYVCQSVGLNAATQPFGYIKTQGKLTLYANRNATDQLAMMHRINTTILSKERDTDERGDPVFLVTVRAETPDGRRTERMGAVPIKGLGGEEYCNAKMKAETKAARRAVIAHVGLGVLDESEARSIAGARLYQPSEVEPADVALPATVQARASEPPPAPPPSNVHQRAELRKLAGAGYPIAPELAARGLESVDDLDTFEAQTLISAGRAYLRTPRAVETAPAPPDAPFTLTAAQISRFWATGANEGWTKEDKRQAMAELYPERAEGDGVVSIKSLTREEFEDLLALFEDRLALAYDGEGKPYLKAAGPPVE